MHAANALDRWSLIFVWVSSVIVGISMLSKPHIILDWLRQTNPTFRTLPSERGLLLGVLFVMAAAAFFAFWIHNLNRL